MGQLNSTISKVFDRLERVLVLINEGRGGNDLVETNRGPKFVGIKLNYVKNKKYIDECDGVSNYDLENLSVECEDDNEEEIRFLQEEI